jgi:hypothetical protein
MGADVVVAADAASLVDIVSGLLLVVGAGVTVTVGTVVLTATAVTRRIRRSPALAGATLHLRALTETGPRREVARLRMQLWRAVEGGRISMAQADAGTGLPGETPALFRRLLREAGTVDQHLRVLQGQDDAAALGAALPALRSRVAEICSLVQRLRSAVTAGLAAASDGGMAELAADVDHEVIALQAGRERMRELDGHRVDPSENGKGALR